MLSGPRMHMPFHSFTLLHCRAHPDANTGEMSYAREGFCVLEMLTRDSEHSLEEKKRL